MRTTLAMTMMMMTAALAGCLGTNTADDIKDELENIDDEPDSYLLFGILPMGIATVNYDAYQLDSSFLVLRTLTEGTIPEPRTPAFTSKLGDISTVNYVYMRSDYFVPGLFKAAPMSADWDDEALQEWLLDAVETNALLVGGFSDSSSGERTIGDHEVLFTEVSYFSQVDNLTMKAIFATWASQESGNAYLLFAMTAPEFTPDDALERVMAKIVTWGDWIDLPPQGSGDPLKGLNVARCTTCESKDGKTITVNFVP